MLSTAAATSSAGFVRQRSRASLWTPCSTLAPPSTAGSPCPCPAPSPTPLEPSTIRRSRRSPDPRTATSSAAELAELTARATRACKMMSRSKRSRRQRRSSPRRRAPDQARRNQRPRRGRTHLRRRRRRRRSRTHLQVLTLRPLHHPRESARRCWLARKRSSCSSPM